MDFKSREELKADTNVKEYSNNDYRGGLLGDLEKALENVDIRNLKYDNDIKVNQVEKQIEYAWIRVYLYEEYEGLVASDKITIEYVPSNEKLSLPFGSYEKKGLHKDHNDVTNYIKDDDKTALCVMLDLGKINNDSEDIPIIRSLFRSSRHYKEELYFKKDIIIKHNDIELAYSSISF